MQKDITLQKGPLLGQGRTAEVFAWGNDKVLKLFYSWFPLWPIEYEAEVGRAVHETGVPAPKVYGVIDCDGRRGIIYQRVYGRSLIRHMEEKPWKIRRFAREMAALHLRIHSARPKEKNGKLPKGKDWFFAAIKEAQEVLGEKRAADICEYVEKIDAGACHVCHGDFHPDNILVASDTGPCAGNSAKNPLESTDLGLMAIDWTNAYAGNPFGDVARTCLMLQSPFMPEGVTKWFLLAARKIKQVVYKAYLSEYLRLSKATAGEMERWILPVAAARLRENVPGEREWLLAIVKHRCRVDLGLCDNHDDR